MKVLFQSDFSLGKTGFGRNARAILSYLHKTGKYDLVHYCCGTPYSAPQHKMLPWKSIGCLPDNPAEMEQINRDPNLAKRASYGEHYLNKIIKDEKPDVYIAAQDIWGVDFAVNKPWFKKINSAIWTTLDSLPILPSAVEAAPNVDNFWVWSSFAMHEMHKLGHTHVKTLHGAVDVDVFKRLSDKERLVLRNVQGISTDSFIIGFVFRNQLRKSVPNLLEGFKQFQCKHPEAKAKLLLHTHYGEGWNIPRLSREYKLLDVDILTTYICQACNKYVVQPFQGMDVGCHFCGQEKSLVTTNVAKGVTEEQLNEIYNLMDTYCHPFTSGGQEIPIQEAKLTELVTLVTNYSCGEEMCEPEANSLPLDWSEFREHGTEFIKASTKPASISRQLSKVFKMKPKGRREMGRKARQWVIDGFSTEHVCKFLEEFIDSCGETTYDFSFETPNRDPNYTIPIIADDAEWVIHMYHNILKLESIDEKDDGFKYWMKEISKGTSRDKIEQYFRQVAAKENKKMEQTTIEDLLDEDDKGRRILYSMPRSAGDVFLSTSLFRSIKELYPSYNLYVATSPEFANILDANPHVHRVIPYNDKFESHHFTEGSGEDEGFFEISFIPFVNTQKYQTYQHNAKDVIAYKDFKYAHS